MYCPAVLVYRGHQVSGLKADRRSQHIALCEFASVNDADAKKAERTVMIDGNSHSEKSGGGGYFEPVCITAADRAVDGL